MKCAKVLIERIEIMLVNKTLKKGIKENYSKQLYRLAKKTILPIAENNHIYENDLLDFLDYLSKFQNNKPELKEILKLYKQNPKLVINLSMYDFSFAQNNLKKYFDLFGEEIFEAHLEHILSLNIEHPNIKLILPYLKDNEELVIKLISNQYTIIYHEQQNIPGDIIANNFDKYIEALNKNLLVNLDDTEITKYLSLDTEVISKFNTWYNLMQSLSIGVSKTEVGTVNNNLTKTMLSKYLIQNPHHLDKFISEIKNAGNIFYLVDFFKMPENKNITESCVYILINNEINFSEQKRLLTNIFYPERPFNSRLRKMIKQQETENYEFPKDVKEYLECFKKLENSESKSDLIAFYELFTNGNLISSEKMEEYIVIEYNKHLESLLTKTEDIAKSDKVTISKEQFTSKQYNKSGEIQIYNLHDVPLVCLGHSIIGSKEDKYDPDEYQEKKEFTANLCKSPHMWTTSPSHGTNYISMSLETTNKMTVFGTPDLYLGFNKLYDTQIKYSHTGDAATPMKRGTAIQNTVSFVSPEECISNYIIGYSEFISERDNVIPDFLITTTTKNNTGLPQLTEQTKEWALYYNIPIFNLDSESYFNENYTMFKNWLERLKNNPNFPTIEEIETLLFLQRKAFLYKQHGDEKYPELMNFNQFSLVLSTIQTQNKEWTQENIENLKNLYSKLRTLSNGNIPEQHQQLEYLQSLIIQKGQETDFTI